MDKSWGNGYLFWLCMSTHSSAWDVHIIVSVVLTQAAHPDCIHCCRPLQISKYGRKLYEYKSSSYVQIEVDASLRLPRDPACATTPALVSRLGSGAVLVVGSIFVTERRAVARARLQGRGAGKDRLNVRLG